MAYHWGRRVKESALLAEAPLILSESPKQSTTKGKTRQGLISKLRLPRQPHYHHQLRVEVSANPSQLEQDQEFLLLSNCSHQTQVSRSWKC